MKQRKPKRVKTGLGNIISGLTHMALGTHKIAKGMTHLRASQQEPIKPTRLQTPVKRTRSRLTKAERLEALNEWTDRDEELAAIYPTIKYKIRRPRRRWLPTINRVFYTSVAINGVQLSRTLRSQIGFIGFTCFIISIIPLFLVLLQIAIVFWILAMIRDVIDYYLGDWIDTSLGIVLHWLDNFYRRIRP